MKFFFLLVSTLFQQVKSTLTKNGVVTASSVYSDTNYGLDGVKDGIFATQNQVGTHKCLHTSNAANQNEWFNIKMEFTSVVETVIIVNREECCLDRIKNTDLYVGFDPRPNKNIACQANPQQSGVFSCGGLSGDYFGLYSNLVNVPLNICQIRAYSWKPNLQYSAVNVSTTVSLGDKLLVFDFATAITSNPGVFVLNSGTNTFWEMTFATSRYVHAVTMIGDYFDSYSDTQNYFLYVSDTTKAILDSLVGQYASTSDKFGKEIVVKKSATSVKLQRSIGIFAFYYIAVFSTAADCSLPTAWDWSSSKNDWPTRLAVGTTVAGPVFTIRNGLDCPVAYSLSLLNGNPVPLFIQYNSVTHQLKLSPSAKADVGSYVLVLKAIMENASDSVEIKFDVFNASAFQLVSPFSTKKIEINTALFQLPNYAPDPADAVLNIQFVLVNAPAFFTIEIDGLQAKINQAAATPGAFDIKLLAVDQFSTLSQDLQFSLVLFSCIPTGFVMTPNVLKMAKLDPQMDVNWIMDTTEPECGSYKISADPPFEYVFDDANKIFQVFAPSSVLGSQLVLIRLSRTTDATQFTTANLSVAIVCPATTQITLPDAITPLFYVVEASQKIYKFQTPVFTPTCINPVEFQLSMADGSVLPEWIQLAPTDNQTMLFGNIPSVAAASYSDIGDISLKVMFISTDSPGISSEQVFVLSVIDCRVVNIQVSQSSLKIFQLGANQLVSITKDPNLMKCGSYDLVISAVASQIVVQQGPNILGGFEANVRADLTNPLGQVSVTFGFKSTLVPTLTATTQQTFTIEACQVVSLSAATQTAINYLIGSPKKLFAFPTFTQIPACGDSITYSLSSPTPLITFDATTNSIAIEATTSQCDQAATYIVKMQAQANTSLYQGSQTLQIQLIDCTPSNLSASPPSLTASQLGTPVFTLLNKSTPNANCGTYEYELSTPLPDFISRTGNKINLAPTLSSQIGSYEFKVKETNKIVLLSAQIILNVQITKCVVLNFTTANTLSTTMFFILGGPAIPFVTPSYSLTPDCKTIPLFRDVNDNFDLQLSLDNKQLLLTPKSSTTFGQKPLSLRAYFEQDPLVFNDLGTKVTCAQVQCSKLASLVYKVSTTGASPVTIINLTSNLVLSGQIKLNDLVFDVKQTNGNALPTWIVFDSQALTFTIQVTDKTIMGQFQFAIGITSALHPGWTCSIDKWQITVQLDTAVNASIPQLNSLTLASLLSLQTIKLGTYWSYTLPLPGYLASDASLNTKNISMIVKVDKDLIIYNQQKNQLVLARDLLAKDVGISVKVKINLNDGTMSADFTISINIVDDPKPEDITREDPSQTNGQNNGQSATSQNLSSQKPIGVQNQGTFVFDPSQWYNGKRLNNSTSTKSSSKKRQLSFGIKSINQNGEILVQFSEPIVVPIKYLEKASNATLPLRYLSIQTAISVQIVPGQESNIQNLTYIWSLEEFTATSMTILVSFDNAKFVSAHEELDSIAVIIRNFQEFVAQSGAVMEEPLLMIQKLPRQMQANSPEVQLANSANKASNGVKSFVVGNVLLSTALSASLNQLFSMVEAQQLVCIITCSNITLPPLPAVFISQFFQIANFDIIPVGWIYERIFYMPPGEAFSANFAAVGFQDMYFINNLGSVFLSIIGFLLLQALALILKQVKNKSLVFKHRMRSFEPTCFWSMPIRVILESYSILSLSALMTLRSHNWQTSGQKIDTILGFIGLAVTVVFPIFVLYLMKKHFVNLHTKLIQHRFGSLFEGFVITNKWIIAFRFWFVLRRLIIACNVIFMKNLMIQIVIWFIQQLISLAILGYSKPFESSREYIIQLVNEVFIQFTIYHVMFFSPFIEDIDVQNGLGYWFCGMLFTHLLANILVIAIITARLKLREFKRWLIVRKELLRLKKIVKERKETYKDNHYGIRRKNFVEYDETSDEDLSEEEEELDLESGYQIRKPSFKKKIMRIGRRNNKMANPGTILEQIDEEDSEDSSSSASQEQSEESKVCDEAALSIPSMEEEEESKHEQTQEHMMINTNEYDEEKVSIQPMMVKSKTEFTNGKETWRDFKGVNNINLFDDEDNYIVDAPFKSEESLDEKQNVFQELPSTFEDNVQQTNSGIQLGFRQRVKVNKASFGQLIDAIEFDRNSKFKEADQLDQLSQPKDILSFDNKFDPLQELEKLTNSFQISEKELAVSPRNVLAIELGSEDSNLQLDNLFNSSDELSVNKKYKLQKRKERNLFPAIARSLSPKKKSRRQKLTEAIQEKIIPKPQPLNQPEMKQLQHATTMLKEFYSQKQYDRELAEQIKIHSNCQEPETLMLNDATRKIQEFYQKGKKEIKIIEKSLERISKTQVMPHK